MADPTEWGAVAEDDRITTADEESLGRSTDLSFLGEAAQDPVGSAQTAGMEILRTGEAGGLEIPRDEPFTPYPMERGTSRASQELPEMFMGSDQMNPRIDEIQQQLDDPNVGYFSKMGLRMEQQDIMEHGEATTHVGTGLGEGLSTPDKLMMSAAAMTMFDPSEVGQMLTQIDPDTGERRWPQFALQTAPDGTLIVNNTENGTRAIINRPGFSPMDAVQMLGIGAAFTPAGRITAAAPAVAGRIALGASTAGLTEAAIQKGQEAAGGQFDPLDIALSTAVGPAVELARPAIGLTQRVGKFIGSYMPENLFGLKNVFQGIEGVIPEAKAQVLGYAKQAKEFLQSGRPAIVTTQDAVPEAHTPFRMILLKMVERLPLTGTGGLRVAQREQRVEVLRNLADRWNLNPNTNYGATVLRDINANAGNRLDAARTAIDQGVDAMADQPVILRDFRLRIRDIIEAEQGYGEMAHQGVIDLLNKTRNAVWQGGQKQDFGRGFGVVNDWLERLYAEAAGAPPGARVLLEDAADALRRDLTRTAQEAGGEGAEQWLRGTRQLETLVSGAERRTLQGLIEGGNVDQQVMRKVLKGGNVEDLQLLARNLSDDGVHEAQQMILRNAMRVGGWRRTAAAEANVDPAKVLRFLEGENVEKQLQTFFSGEAQAELGGMMEYLRTTAAAQQIGKGVGMAAAGGMGQMSANAMNIVTLGAIGALGHAYQSIPIRNLLLRLEHIKSDPRLKDVIMSELTPLLMAGGRQMAQQWDESDPQDMVYVSDEFAEEQSMQDQSLINQGMEQLRTAAGNEEEDPGMTTRLMQMLGEGEEEAPVQ